MTHTHDEHLSRLPMPVPGTPESVAIHVRIFRSLSDEHLSQQLDRTLHHHRQVRDEVTAITAVYAERGISVDEDHTITVVGVYDESLWEAAASMIPEYLP